MLRPSHYFDNAIACCAIIFFIALHSCNPNNASVVQHPEALKIAAPNIVQAGKPYVVNLDTCPNPQTFIVPVKDSFQVLIQTPDWEQKVMLKPPAVQAADFFIPMSKFANEQGLEAHSVYSSFEDKAGNLWFGTHGGAVTRYDGKTAVTFSNLPCNDVRATFGDKDGNIWFGMGGCGAIKYDGKGFTNFTTAQGLIGNEVRCFAQDKTGNIWMGTQDKGISCFNGKQFINYDTSDLPGNKVLSIVRDTRENIWFATNAGASCFNGKSFSTVMMPGGKDDNNIRTIVCSKKGNLWFGTANGVFKYDGQAFTHFTTADGLTSNNINCVVTDDNDHLWIGTFGGGICRYDGEKFETLTRKQGLASDFIKTIVPGKNGCLWIGAEGGGVTRYEGAAVTSYTTAQGLFNNYIVCIKEDKKGSIWMGSNAGELSVYDGKSFANFSRQQGFVQGGRINFIIQDKKDNLWICSNSGFCCYDGKRFTNYNTFHGIRNSQVQCVTEDQLGNLWFGVEFGGLSVFDGKTVSNFTTAQGLPGNNVRAIIQDSTGGFWIATFGGGISRYNGKTFMNFDTTQGLSSNFVSCMKLDSRGNLWMGTAISGACILRKETIDRLEKDGNSVPGKLFERFMANEGLANNTVYDIIEDKKGNIILATNFGLTVIKNGILPGSDIQSRGIEQYNQRTGYAITDMNERAMFIDSKGMLWAGTGGDLIRFDYSAIRKDTAPPKLYIQGIKINNEYPGWNYISTRNNMEKKMDGYALSAIEIEEKDNYSNLQTSYFRDSLYQKFKGVKFDSIARFYPVPLHLELPYRNNNITIEFGAIETARPAQVRYQYMLQGNDEHWSPVNNQSFASFGNMHEGQYTFRVKALSPDGVWSQPVTYKFKVLPPWYRTFWAYLMYAFVILLSLYTIYKNRIRKLEAEQAQQLKTVIATQEEERKRISRDLHDDVGTKLSALKLFLSSLKSQAEKKQYQQVDQLASNSEQLISETIKDVREMLLNLSPGILEEFGYIHAVEGLISKINQTESIHVDLTVFGLQYRLKKEYELALYRITQELINNVLKHAEAKNVSVQIGCRDEMIVVMVEDDGKGFDIDEHKDGYGLKNLEARTNLLHGTIMIDSRPGKGTSVLIEVPYKLNHS